MKTVAPITTVGPNRHFLGLTARACGCHDLTAHLNAQWSTILELNHRIKTAWQHQRPALIERRDDILTAIRRDIDQPPPLAAADEGLYSSPADAIGTGFIDSETND